MSSLRVTPSVYAHSSRPEWGRAVVAEELEDRTTYVFENAGERTFMNAPFRLVRVDLPAEERDALATALLRHRARRTRAKKPSTRAAKAKPADAMAFEQQEVSFTARFVDGFAGDQYAHEVRGASEGDEQNLDALIALARELFAPERLDAAIARGAFDEVHADAAKVLAASKRLAFAKIDKPVFDKIPASGHEQFARALRGLLYGEGAYAVRFNAFVKSIGAKGVPWTIATIFAAAVHPDAHVLVKPVSSQRQARVLGLAEPPSRSPSGAVYAKHLAVAQALRERLVAAGRTPRDLFDVYMYEWRTLGKSAPAAAPPS